MGGGLAAANSLRTNRNAIKFNPAALTKKTMKNLGLTPSTSKGQIINIVIKGEIVSVLQNSLGLSPIGETQTISISQIPYSLLPSWLNILQRTRNHFINTIIQQLENEENLIAIREFIRKKKEAETNEDAIN